MDLSFAAEIPAGKTLFVKRELIEVQGENSGFGFNTWAGFIVENSNTNIFRCPGQQSMNNKLSVTGYSRFKISCYDGSLDNLIFEKEVSLSES